LSQNRFVEKSYTSQDGLSLYYRDYPALQNSGVPVLCLAGLTRNSQDFHDLASRLSEHRRVICPDYRGRGKSQYDKDWRNYIPRTYVDDIRHLMVVSGLHRMVVIGTSMGGILASALAVATPSALAGAVLNDVGPDINPQGIAKIIAYISNDTSLENLDAVIRHLQSTFPNLPASDEQGWLKIAEATFRQCDDGLYRFNWDPDLALPFQRNTFQTPDLWPMFRALSRTPAAAIRGQLSDVLSEETFSRMENEISGLECCTVNGVGHAPSLSEPECQDLIESVLAKADKKGH